MDIKHFYFEKGQGDPVILLHGNGENCTYFKNQLDVFAEKYKVYALDTRGHGKTPRGNKPFTIRQFADDLLDFMDEHHIERTHLLDYLYFSSVRFNTGPFPPVGKLPVKH